MMQYTSVCT